VSTIVAGARAFPAAVAELTLLGRSSMRPLMTSILARRSNQLLLATLFSVVSKMALCLNDRTTAMGLSRPLAWFEEPMAWFSVYLQPWVLIVFWAFRHLNIHSELAITSTAAALSSAIIFGVSRLVAARWPRFYTVIVVILLAATVSTTNSAIADLATIHRGSQFPE